MDDLQEILLGKDPIRGYSTLARTSSHAAVRGFD